MPNDNRYQLLLDTVLSILVNDGYQNFSMLKVARSAGSSKETLYKYFGNKQGLFRALIENKSNKADLFKPYFSLHKNDAKACLAHFGTDLLSLIMSDESIAINRMVISLSLQEPELAVLLDKYGKKPIVNHILTEFEKYNSQESRLILDHFEDFISLQINSVQIDVLMGLKDPISKKEIDKHTMLTIKKFYTLIKLLC